MSKLIIAFHILVFHFTVESEHFGKEKERRSDKPIRQNNIQQETFW